MSDTKRCPQCGAAVESAVAGQPCPGCLMKLGLESWTQQQSKSDDLRLSPTTPPDRGFIAPSIENLASSFPQLELLELIGQGGMGAVYKARQKALDRVVALKILPTELAEDAGFAERFMREAKSLARLNHPNIVTVFDFGRAGELYYFMMEFVEGSNLRSVLRSGGVTPPQALAIVPQICEALQFAHDNGIVHRDIKPENILLTPTGRVKIADFGLAKLLGLAPSGNRLTRTQQVMGTPQYMAPEQFERPESVDHRSDIYALGVVFYEMLTGELPLGRFEAPSKRVQVDVRLDDVVLRALEKEPARRYQRAGEVKTEIESIGSRPSIQSDAASRGGMRIMQKANAPMLLLISISLVISALVMAAGVALAGVAVLTSKGDPNAFWGWMGGAFGCFVGGGGALLGTWNTYRQLEGAGDLMQDPNVNWLDRLMYGYLGVGLTLLLAGLVAAPLVTSTTSYALMLLGGVSAGQALFFMVVRALMRRSARAEKTVVDS